MNRNRIVVPTTLLDLPAPHFDDEATIVSARQVVPITKAKVVEGSRALLWILPILLSAAVFGALGAIGVNYFDSRRHSTVVSAPQSEIGQQVNQPPSQTQSEVSLDSKPEAVGGVVAASESSSSESESSQSLTGNQSGNSSSSVDSKELDTQPVQIKPASSTSSDQTKLVRKRRVHPVNQPNDATPPPAEKPGKNKRGAGHIQEIFEGVNPP